MRNKTERIKQVLNRAVHIKACFLFVLKCELQQYRTGYWSAYKAIQHFYKYWLLALKCFGVGFSPLSLVNLVKLRKPRKTSWVSAIIINMPDSDLGFFIGQKNGFFKPGITWAQKFLLIFWPVTSWKRKPILLH